MTHSSLPPPSSRNFDKNKQKITLRVVSLKQADFSYSPLSISGSVLHQNTHSTLRASSDLARELRRVVDSSMRSHVV